MIHFNGVLITFLVLQWLIKTISVPEYQVQTHLETLWLDHQTPPTVDSPDDTFQRRAHSISRALAAG